MSYNVQSLKNDMTGALHGTTVNQIQGIDYVIDRAARQLLLDLDPQETKRTLEFTGPIFNSIYDYPLAADVKGNKIIDIFPQVLRLPRDIWTQAYAQAFDVAKQNIYASPNLFNINFNTGLKTIRINAPYLNPPVYLDETEAIASNGTWTAGGTASNLSVNNSNFVLGGGSLQFDITTGTGYIENSTLQAVDLSQLVNQAYLFTDAYVPIGASLTSVEIRWGSSAANYYSSTATQTQAGTVFQNGWNQEQFIWSAATTTGTPDPANLTYARISLTVTADMSGCLINGLYAILGSILSYSYYSKYLFRDAVTAAFQETVTDDSNLINLDTDSYSLLTNLAIYYAIQQQQGLDAQFYDGNFFLAEYQKGVMRYKALYKSEVQKPQSMYYQVNRAGYPNWGRRWNY